MFLTFSNSILLVGLAGAVVPLVLHLLSRANYQSVDWGAMLFLEGVESAHQHSTRLNQITLLLLRMAVVGLLAVALAEPVWQQWGPEADTVPAALRAADHGQLLCIGGAVACAAAGVLVAVAFVSSRGGLSGARRVAYLTLLALAVGGSVWLGRRASAWGQEVGRLLAQQPQTSLRTGSDPSLRSRVDAAILLDCSPSMNFEENGHTRFSLAQAAAKQVLAGLHRGDRVSLVLMGRKQTEAEIDPTADLQSVADRIDAARPGHDPTDVADELIRGIEGLDHGGRLSRDLYVVCDRQALSWQGVNDYFMTRRWPEAVHKSASAVRIFVVPIGDSDAENVAVESIRLADPPAIVSQPAELQVVVHNLGSATRSAVPLRVWVNGKPSFDTTVTVAAGRTASVSVPIKPGQLTTAGPQVVSAEVRTTGYRDDDHLDAVVDAIDPIRVLVISGDDWAGAGPFRNESDFLRLALAPLQSSHRKGVDPCKVEVISAEQWSHVDLRSYQVVILANIEQFGPAQARAIEQYVYGGGGLLLAPGSLARVDSYNDELWRDGAGILPAGLQDATTADGSEATAIVGYDPTTPVFQFLHDRPDLTLSATIGRYFPTTARPSDARVLAWYTSGAPFLIESRAGRGKVLLMTTSLDADWSTLPLSNFYLPFVQSAVRYLAAGTLPRHNLSLGEPIQVMFEDPVEDKASVELPDGDQRPLTVVHFGSVSEVRFADTNEPGVYRIHAKDPAGERTLAFAVQLPQRESDLTQLDEKRWSELEDGLHLKRVDPNERAIAAVVSGSREGHDLWPWALAGVLLLGACELGLARHWSRDLN